MAPAFKASVLPSRRLSGRALLLAARRTGRQVLVGVDVIDNLIGQVAPPCKLLRRYVAPARPDPGGNPEEPCVRVKKRRFLGIISGHSLTAGRGEVGSSIAKRSAQSVEFYICRKGRHNLVASGRYACGRYACGHRGRRRCGGVVGQKEEREEREERRSNSVQGGMSRPRCCFLPGARFSTRSAAARASRSGHRDQATAHRTLREAFHTASLCRARVG